MRRNHIWLPIALWLCVFAMLMFTRYSADPQSPFLFDSVIQQLISTVYSTEQDPLPFPYESMTVPLTTSSLSLWHTIGAGIYLCLSTIVTVCLWSSDQAHHRIGRSLGVQAPVLYAAAFVPPFIGVNLLIFSRWLGFIYFSVAVLAAAGLWISTHSISVSINRTVVVFLVVTIACGLMGVSYFAAPAGTPAGGAFAQDFTVSPHEKEAFEFATAHSETTIHSDHLSVTVLQRWYRNDATSFYITYPEWETTGIAQGELIFTRPVTTSSKANYYINYGSGWTRVVGPTPDNIISCTYDDKFYSGGKDTTLRSRNTGC